MINGPVANQTGRSNNRVCMGWVGRLETDHVCDMLIGWRLLFVSAFPLLEIPNFKTAASADERDLALQTEFLAEIFRQDETPLLVRCAVLRARMELAQKDTAVPRGDRGIVLHLTTH